MLSGQAGLSLLSGQSGLTQHLREFRLPKSGALAGKLIGGGVAFALATDWRSCTLQTTFNYGNLPRGVNPLFMFSKALPTLVGYATGFQIYLEDIVISTDQALCCGLVNCVAGDRMRAKSIASVTLSQAQWFCRAETTVARACTTDAAHAALEVACFLESFASRNKAQETSRDPSHSVQPEPQRTRMDLEGVVTTQTVVTAPRRATVDQGRLVSTVSSCAFEVLGTKVSGDVPLMEAGVDSLAASELSGAIGKELDVELPATLLFDHPSIDGIVSLMVQELGNTGAPASMLIPRAVGD